MERNRLNSGCQASVERWKVFLNHHPTPNASRGLFRWRVVREERRGDLPGRRRWPQGQGHWVTVCLLLARSRA